MHYDSIFVVVVVVCVSSICTTDHIEQDAIQCCWTSKQKVAGSDWGLIRTVMMAQWLKY